MRPDRILHVSYTYRRLPTPDPQRTVTRAEYNARHAAPMRIAEVNPRVAMETRTLRTVKGARFWDMVGDVAYTDHDRGMKSTASSFILPA